MTAPYQPSILAPLDSAVVDLAAGLPISFVYEPAAGSGALARWELSRLNGATWEWWDAVALTWTTSTDNDVSLLTPNSDGSWTYAFPAASWAYGAWPWRLVTIEAIAGDASDPSLQTIYGAPSPGAALAAPSVSTPTPSYSWTFTPASGGSQATWALYVYDLATTILPGFAAGVTDAVFSAGDASGASSVTQDPGYLANGNSLVAYVQVGELVTVGGVPVVALSAFASVAWTVAFAGPNTPTLVVVAQLDMTTEAPQLKVTVTAVPGGPAPAPTWAHIQYSDDGSTWYDLAAHIALVAGAAHVVDSAVRPGVTRTYRAAVVAVVSGVNRATAWVSAAGTAVVDTWCLLDPAHPSGAVTFNLAGDPHFTVHEQATRYYPLGRPHGVKSSDGTKGTAGGLTSRITSHSTQRALEALLRSTGTLMLIAPWDAWAISLEGDRSSGIVYTTAALPMPFFDTSFAWTEAPTPATVGGRAP